MNSIGICVGASSISSVKVVRTENGEIQVARVTVKPHQGNPRQVFLKILNEMEADRAERIAITGRKFRHFLKASSLSEPEAVEEALLYLNGRGEAVSAVISAGGESFIVYPVGSDGRISSVQTGNKCASGTGEFFIQQLRRIDLSLDEAFILAEGENPYRVSGRCSVFCKSDCTHATNKGVPKGRIAAGLCEMMAGKILEILKQLPKRDMLIIGGAARNPLMIKSLKKEIENLKVPKEAAYFEAFGAALWALKRETLPLPPVKDIFKDKVSSFSFLPPLESFREMVDFKTVPRGLPREGDRCILGLDVGSTTTKAVLLRISDDRILKSVYLRTGGDPVGASRACYGSLLEKLGPLADDIRIIGLGVTGSGRQIAGLHALTGGIINEIIAHATGALHFDKTVDTIFEIGGQDAKYTFIRGGVPSDYAMNDACSAGTGSFLEEAAKETMGLKMEEIAAIALKGKRPPNFNDQCAAFISSDIKNAFHEGISQEDVVAGLVYSICQNYNNRVKGNRQAGGNIFMQGGVCYNAAVPLAMAALTGQRIVVPPDPGLIGAFGVALEIKRRLAIGLLEEKSFSLGALRDRELVRESPFICRGGREGCDRKCEITRIRIEGKGYPFGGACNRWYNERFNLAVDADRLNLVRRHEELVFDRYARLPEGFVLPPAARSLGINKSFFTNSYYPLFFNFFSRLGFRVVLPGEIDPAGVDQKRAAFCYPAEIAHGFFLNLLGGKPDYIFLPQVKGTYVENGARHKTACPISQGEPYYLSQTFRDHPALTEIACRKGILRPVLDFSRDRNELKKKFVRIGLDLSRSPAEAREAFEAAWGVYEEFRARRRELGREFLAELARDPDRIAVVIFGRSYNAYVTEANMGIPQKFASRGIGVIPVDFLPLADEAIDDTMYWSSGQIILKGAGFVSRHPQLFGCYISNFSCGPDSFIGGYFREKMGRKPFLLLELDSHVADAGLETRVEALLDIIKNYRQLEKTNPGIFALPPRKKAAGFNYETGRVADSRGREYPLNHPRVHLVFPSMGARVNEAAAAVFRGLGIRATALAKADEEVLKLGRGNSTCKECLPLQLTVGSLLKYLQTRSDPDELLVYFMPTASGPCRFGQYMPFIKAYVEREGLADVALFSLRAETSYSEALGNDVTLKLWSALILAHIFQDLHSLFLVNARDRQGALELLDENWFKMLGVLTGSPDLPAVKRALTGAAEVFAGIPLKKGWRETPSVLLTGEIFVRLDDLSRQHLVERLADQGFFAKVSSIMEWIYYTDWCVKNGISARGIDLKGRVKLFLRSWWMRSYERELSEIIARADLLPCRLEDVDLVIDNARHIINPELSGEAILTIGGALTEVPKHYDGVIAIGPFGCMPNQIAEAILSREMGPGWQQAPWASGLGPGFGSIPELPFLAVESDGNPFPQIINAKLEVFMLQAARLHEARLGKGAK